MSEMKEQSSQQDSIYIKEVEKHQKRYTRILELTHSTTKAAAVMLLAAIVSLVVANSAFYVGFTGFWHTELSIGFGKFSVSMTLAHIINDIFMAIFFLLVGLEIKYEMTVGELTNIRQAILPVGAAVGGVLAPVVIYLSFNATSPETLHGWGVPTATDIAFALGILALLGSRVPAGSRVFLSTLAVADDIIAILVIAVFYGHSPSVEWLVAAAIVFGLLLFMNHRHIYSLAPYLVVGVVLWYCIFMSGVHSTIAGVLLAFAIPSGSRVKLKKFIDWSGDRVAAARSAFNPKIPVIGQEDYLEQVTRLSRVARQVVPPATRLERLLYPWVYFAILPLFALTNADVVFDNNVIGGMLFDPVFLGVFCGLVLGKPIGIMLLSIIIVKAKISSLPENVNWGHMLGTALLGGVGFTMAIFVANLAFSDPSQIALAKIAILSASLVAGIIGFCFLWIQAKAAARKGIRYETNTENSANLQTHVAHEAARKARRRRKKEKAWKQAHSNLVENMEENIKRSEEGVAVSAQPSDVAAGSASVDKHFAILQNDVVETRSHND